MDIQWKGHIHEANGDILWNQRRQGGFMKVVLVMLGVYLVRTPHAIEYVQFDVGFEYGHPMERTYS